jgi:hypothetical protein
VEIRKFWVLVRTLVHAVEILVGRWGRGLGTREIAPCWPPKDTWI